jgi:TRAP-type C4-dicarboxylate transport system substrate-binding protein
MTEYPSTNVLGALVVTKQMWDKVPPDHQKKIRPLTREYCQRIQKGHEAQNEKSITVLKKAGISIVRIQDAAGHQKFITETADKTMNALVGKMYSQELLDRTLAYLEEYRKANPDSGVATLE